MTASSAVKYPVIGELAPTLLSVIRPDLDCGYGEYVTATMQGLARVEEGHLDLLAIVAHAPGRGDCGRFLAECQRAYRSVTVWEIGNPALAAMLTRREYRPVTQYSDGGLVHGMRWEITR